MPKIITRISESEKRTISLSQGETVLSGLLREGVDVPYGCKSGVCHSCILKSNSSDIPHEAQKGLLSVEKSQGYFLSCCCRPESDIEVDLSSRIDRYPTKIQTIDKISESVWRLRLDKSIAYRSGQYLTLRHTSGITRSYSIASHPIEDDFIECHIRIYPDGKFSHLVENELKAGDCLEILGPYGKCVYEKGAKDQTLFLAGLGTGLSPLYGIVRDAKMQGHRGKVVMLIASSSSSNLYYTQEVGLLQREYSNIEVHYSVQSNETGNGAILPTSDVYSKAAEILPSLEGCQVFLCGSQSFVQRMRKDSFLRGANMSDIRVDEFIRAYA